MSDLIVAAIVASVPPTIVGIAALLKVIGVHKSLNSRLSQWREETAQATIASNAAAKAEGIKEGEGKINVSIKPIIIAAACLCLAGCSSTNITRLVGALAKDPATVAVSVQSVYGTVYILRTGSTNQQIILGPISVK